MPTDVLNQLRVLRESIADALRKDPRYLTLVTLDRSIAEISGVLDASGIGGAPSSTTPFNLDPGAPGAPPAPAPSALPPQHVQPHAPAASEGAAAGVAAEAVHQMHGTPEHSSPAAAKPEAVEGEDPDPEPGHPDAHPAHEAEAHADDVTPDAEPAEDVVPHDFAAHEPVDHEAAAHEATAHEDSAEQDATPHEVATLADRPDASEESADPAQQAAALESDDHAPGPHADAAGGGLYDSGYVPMAPRPNAARYSPSISVKFGKLPNRVDLRPLMTPIEDQGSALSGVAAAVAGAYEYWIKKALKQDQSLSRLFISYNARWRDGAEEQDAGSTIQFAMEGLSKFGACDDTVWPADEELILKKPCAEAYQDAAPFRIQDAAQVPLKLDAWKQALAEGKPIVFGILLFGDTDACSHQGGLVTLPAPDEIANQGHSAHAMCAVGYSESERVFIVRNSWGEGWGDGGYCYMPYAYLMNPKFNGADSWVFVPKVPSQPPRETWSDDTAPVSNGGHGVDIPIEPHAIADYDAVDFDGWSEIRRPYKEAAPEEFAEYVSWASKGLWDQMESFDAREYLASTVALTGISSLVASQFASFGTAPAPSQEDDADPSADDHDAEPTGHKP